jgi:hypothetical protein
MGHPTVVEPQQLDVELRIAPRQQPSLADAFVTVPGMEGFSLAAPCSDFWLSEQRVNAFTVTHGVEGAAPKLAEFMDR